MKMSTNDPMIPGTLALRTPVFQGMEDALRDACARATQPAVPRATLRHLHRSVVGLAQALMQARADIGLPPTLSDDLTALLAAVRDTAGVHGRERTLPQSDAMPLHRSTIALARVAHRAREKQIVRPIRTGRIVLPGDARKPPHPL